MTLLGEIRQYYFFASHCLGMFCNVMTFPFSFCIFVSFLSLLKPYFHVMHQRHLR